MYPHMLRPSLTPPAPGDVGAGPRVPAARQQGAEGSDARPDHSVRAPSGIRTTARFAVP